MIFRCSVHSRGGHASQELRGVAHVGPKKSEFLLQGRTRHGADWMNLWEQIETAEAAGS